MDLPKSAKTAKRIEKAYEELQDYYLRTKRSSGNLKTSIQVSAMDLGQDILNLIKSPSSTEVFHLIKDTVGSAAWITNSYLKLLGTSFGRKKVVFGNLEDSHGQYLIDKVSKNIRIDESKYSKQQIFDAIYRELDYSHHNLRYKSSLKIPKIFPTIVLVSGILNEIYKTAAFERGVKHLSEVTGLKYFSVDTHGFKSATYNVGLIRKQLFDYVEQNPDEKLWIIAYSKGGIDSLHFLVEERLWATRHVVGLSTIASPILGSEHLDHKMIRIINTLQGLKKTAFAKYIKENWDFLFKEFQDSLSHRTRRPWFLNNYHLLPDNLFYSALGLEAQWYESHIYMMLAKIFFPSQKKNDGIVDADNAFFPDYFSNLNLGTIKGHHLIGARSSSYSQEALIASHIIFLKYLNYI